MSLIERSFREKLVLVGMVLGSAPLEETEAHLDELALLVDMNEIHSVRDELVRLSVESRIFEGKSAALKMSEQFNDRISKVRCFHIDGDRSGYSTYNDLCLAEEFISGSIEFRVGQAA